MINQTFLAEIKIGQGDATSRLLLSTSSTDVSTNLIPWAKDMACSPSTLWHNLDTSYSLLEEAFPLFINGYGLSEKQGLFTVDCQSDATRINTPFYRFLFFLYPSSLDPLQALTIFDRQTGGTLSPALIAALVAAAYGFDHGHLTLEGSPAIFAKIAGQLPSAGPSILSDSEIMHRLKEFVKPSDRAPVSLSSVLPQRSLDRARFLVALSELCWQPAVCRKLSSRFEADPSLALVASAWLSSGPDFADPADVSFLKENASLRHKMPDCQSTVRFAEFVRSS